MQTPCNFGTIRQIRARLKSEGYAVSEYALRQWVKDGLIRAVYSGKRAYLRYDNVLTALNGSDTERPA